MSTWHEYVQQKATIPEWPYPVNYGKVNEVKTDVLVIGGGVAGCRAMFPRDSYFWTCWGIACNTKYD